MIDPAPPPRWDLDAFFPGVGSRPLADARDRLRADLARLEALYDRHDVGPGPDRSPDADDVAACEAVLAATNQLLADTRLVGAYLHAATSADVGDEAAAAAQGAHAQQLAPLGPLLARLEAWTARLGADALVAASPMAADHAHVLERFEAAATHQLPGDGEALAAELRLTGSTAWARLHREVTAGLTVTVAPPDRPPERVPMTVARGMASDPDPARRRAAYEGELDAWAGAAVPLAAALDAATGERLVLDRRRGWADPLEPALVANSVDRATLEAMTEAVVDGLGDLRRYLRVKAAALGSAGVDGGLPWWDLLAPLGTAGPVGWAQAVEQVRTSLGTRRAALGELVKRAVDGGWIDAEPRPGKVAGAFCLPVRAGESRVLLSFDGSPRSVQTLAHELGHAYHNAQLADRLPLQRRTPMALAETASIFFETLVTEAALEATDDEGARLALLDADLQGACMVVVDIHSRYRFEHALCERRARGPVRAGELCELMAAAQEDAYGDGLATDHRHPWMWAAKSHYFTPFYNWPYTFGLLFGLALHRRQVEDPERFWTGYDGLLASTGMQDADRLAARFGIDLRSGAEWAASLDVLRRRIDELEAITACQGRRQLDGGGT